MEHQVAKADFNSYGARRGNHEVMMRGTFANIRIKNEMVPGVEGGYTAFHGEVLPIYDAAMKYKADGTPLVVIAGKNTAPARRATGRPRAPTCWACAR
jgi:aconitate hydratase